MSLLAQITAAFIFMTTGALAGSDARGDGSGVAIAIFLAFCALIIVGQLLPLFRTRIRGQKSAPSAEKHMPVNADQRKK